MEMMVVEHLHHSTNFSTLHVAFAGRLNRAHCGFGPENRVYLSGAGVGSIITVLRWQRTDCKILIDPNFATLLFCRTTGR
jgi:hypothetical protein